MIDSGVNESMNAGGQQGGTQPGAQLQAYREAHGWTIEQVASQLNLAPRQIQAIERDDYAALPGMPIARGFIRAYAKLLKVDAAPLLANMADQPAATDESTALRRTMPSTPFFEASLQSRTQRSLKRKYIAGVAIVALLLAAIWAMQQTGILPGLDISGSLNPTVKEGSVAPSGSTSESSEPVPSISGDTTAPESVPAVNVPGSVESEAAASNTMPDVAVAPPVAAPDANAVKGDGAVPGKEALVLKMREDSWVEIKSSNDRTVFAQLVKAGTTETFAVKEPLSLVIGNAAGVDATLRGSPLELEASARSNVARLNVK